jgi:hypothetical protein
MKKLSTLTVLFLMISLAGFANTWHPQKMNPKNFRNYLQQFQKMNRLNKLKSAEVTKQSLDSVISENGARNLYEYDSHGNIVLEEAYLRNSPSDPWIGQYKTDNSYDENGYLVEYLSFKWDENTNGWLNDVKGELSYNSYQKIAVMILYQWDADAGEWKNLMKWEVDKFDANGNDLKYSGYMWDPSGTWVVAAGGESTYDANGNIITETGDNFGMKFKIDYSYDGNGNLILSIDYEWDETGAKWINSSKTEYTYCTDGKDHEEIYYLWRDGEQKFEESDKTEYVYDVDRNMIKEIATHWGGSKGWVNSTKEEYVCDNNYSVSDLIVPMDCEFCHNQIHKVTEVRYYSWDDSKTDWDFGGTAVLYYSERDMTVAKELNGESIRVFPNPATDFVTITLQQNSNPAQFELFDIQGHKILAKEVVSNQKVSLKELSEGLYFYNLLSENGRISGKLIKQ